NEALLDKNKLDSWRKELHEAGIPKAQGERLINKFLSEAFNEYTTREQARVKEIEQNELRIKQEFGARFDEEVNYARWAVKEFGNDELGQLLEQTGLGSHPSVVKLFAKIG